MTLEIPPFHNSKVLVIGDIMLDRYWTGPTSRISPEAPVPVVRINETENRLGGAANVARNLVSLGCTTTLCGVIGADEAGQSIQALLNAAGIGNAFTTSKTTPTITKLRIISRHQQLIRLDFEESTAQPNDDLMANFIAHLAGVDAVVISDYAKGTIVDARPLIAACVEQNIPVFIDPKGSDFSQYACATAITPNLNELEGVVGKTTSMADICEQAAKLRTTLNLESLLVTLSERGMVLIQQDQEPLEIPTLAREVFDVTGAGDTVIATLAGAVASGASLPDATRLANIAAGIVVGKLGTAWVSVDEIEAALAPEPTQSAHGVIPIEDLEREVAERRRRGEKIVFTNGCFDILHAGHVAYLEQARQLGDRLVIGVNSDASIRKLKGPKRPLIPLEQRMQLLAALRCVDWVVPFEDETPARLIASLMPDVLVKGGDYKAKDIVGYETVTGRGGEVVVMPFVEGWSTSNIIQQIVETHLDAE